MRNKWKCCPRIRASNSCSLHWAKVMVNRSEDPCLCSTIYNSLPSMSLYWLSPECKEGWASIQKGQENGENLCPQFIIFWGLNCNAGYIQFITMYIKLLYDPENVRDSSGLTSVPFWTTQSLKWALPVGRGTGDPQAQHPLKRADSCSAAPHTSHPLEMEEVGGWGTEKEKERVSRIFQQTNHYHPLGKSGDRLLGEYKFRNPGGLPWWPSG